MTKFSTIITTVILLVFGFSSCDYVELPNEDSVTGGPSPTTDTRRVLIMDFTGHRCAGCPAAAKIANNIATQFPEQVYVMAIHPDMNGLTTPAEGAPGEAFTTDWRTPEGNNYQLLYTIPPAIPLGAVSATEIGGNLWAQSGTWQGEAEELIALEREINIDLEVTYDETSRELDAVADVTFETALDDNYNIVFSVLETNIVDWQKNGSGGVPADSDYPYGDIDNYVHKHVLRKHLNGLLGEEVNAEPVNAGAEFQLTASEVLSEDYVAEEVSIMVYIYNVNTLEILDVTESHIIE